MFSTLPSVELHVQHEQATDEREDFASSRGGDSGPPRERAFDTQFKLCTYYYDYYQYE